MATDLESVGLPRELEDESWKGSDSSESEENGTAAMELMVGKKRKRCLKKNKSEAKK